MGNIGLEDKFKGGGDLWSIRKVCRRFVFIYMSEIHHQLWLMY